MAKTRKVFELRDNGLYLIAIKYIDKPFPYRVYKMRDPWHRKQIAKCEDLATVTAVAYEYIMQGG